MKLWIIILICCFFVGGISAEVILVKPSTGTITNASLLNVNHSNSSDFWDNLDTPADILHNLLDNLAWSVAGHTIDTNIDMNGNTFTDLENVIINSGSYIGSWGTVLRVANSLMPIGALDLGNKTAPWRSLYINGTNSNITLNDTAISDWSSVNGSLDKWIMNNPWLYNDSTIAYFNETKLATVYYNASQPNMVAGTIDSGTISDTQHEDGKYDGKSFNFSEQAGSPGLDLRINFTGIDDFNQGVMRYKTSSLAGVYPIIQLWNYDDLIWEDYPAVGESSSFATITQSVFDSADHVSGGAVQMRIYKLSNGNTNNHYYIDWIAISKGFGTPSGNEVDPFSFHKGENLNNTDYNITADNFYKEENKAGFCTNATHWFMGNITQAYEQGWCS